MFGFLVMVFGVLFFLHFVVYIFVTRFFGITQKKSKINLTIVLSALSVSPIISAVLTRTIDNPLTGFFYFFSWLWIGLAINLLMMITVSVVMLIVFKILKKNIDSKILGAITILIALVISIFGVWNAYHPQIKKIEVELENLPAEWQGKTIVQITDLHLGNILRENFLTGVIEKVNSLNPEIVVITGDLFDGMDGNITPLAKMLDNIKTKRGVYYVTGNHETYIGVDKSVAALKPTQVKVLNDEVVHLGGLQILGISYPEMGQIKNIKDIVLTNKDFVQDESSILLYHAPVGIGGGIGDDHKDIYLGPNTDFTDAQEIGIDLQLSGHTHQGQIFPFSILAGLIFNGYDHGLHTLNNFNIYTSSGTGVWGPTMRTGSRSEITSITLR